MDRKLLKLTLTSCSSRVFNCLSSTRHLVAAGASSADKGLFSVRPLNYGILFKEPTDRSWNGDPDRPADTLLYFPFNEDLLADGGVSISLNDPRFDAVLQEFVQTFGTAENRGADNDRAILRVFRDTPSLDPYLLKSSFDQAGVRIPDGYLKVADHEWRAIRDYVKQRLMPMILFGLSGDAGKCAARVDEFVTRIWDGSDVSCLFPLLESLLVDLSSAADVVFAWKALTLIEYQYSKRLYSVRSCASWLNYRSKPADSMRYEDRCQLDARREEIRKLMRRNLLVIVEVLNEYRNAYDDLFVKKAGPAKFFQFIHKCRRHYITVGTALNKVEHCTELMTHALENDFRNVLKADELYELFQMMGEILR